MIEESTSSSSPKVEPGRVFPDTPWSLIVRSQQVEDEQALAALDRLARAYWRPLVVYARSSGLDENAAQDEVQRLFEQLISRDSLRTVMPGESRFRSFLIQCLRNTMVSTHRQENRLKRGAGAEHEPLENHVATAESRDESPARALDRAWAAEVFEKAFEQLRLDAQKRGRARQLTVLEPVLRGKPREDGYAGIAAELDATEGAVRKMIFDLRARLGMLIRQQVSFTVADPAEVGDELRHLISLL